MADEQDRDIANSPPSNDADGRAAQSATPAESAPPAGEGVSAAAGPSAVDAHVERLLQQSIDVPELASAVQRQEPADAADTLERLEEDEAADVLGEMEDKLAADALGEMEPALAMGVLEDLLEEDQAYAVRLVELMDDDKAADVVQILPEPFRQRLLAAMEAGAAKVLAQLIGYDKESAGGMMTTDFLALRQGMTVREAIGHIRDREVSDHIQHALVTDRRDRLVGIVALYRLLLADPMRKVAEIMKRNVKVVYPQTDREHVAREFDRYDYSMLPVVDEKHRPLGIVTVDDVIDIIRAEQTEDVQKTVGAGAGEAVYSRLSEKMRGRFPWLVISLFMMMPAALIVQLFGDLIARMPILAGLMPVIAALVGNAGHQALAVTQRGLVLDQVPPERVGYLLLREWSVGLLNGALLGLLIVAGIGALSMASDNASWTLGIVTGAASMIAMSVGTFFGSAIPLLMKRLGFDPAQSSAIILIMITDSLSFFAILSLSFLIFESAGLGG